jgi:hypothetical protein
MAGVFAHSRIAIIEHAVFRLKQTNPKTSKNASTAAFMVSPMGNDLIRDESPSMAF